MLPPVLPKPMVTMTVSNSVQKQLLHAALVAVGPRSAVCAPPSSDGSVTCGMLSSDAEALADFLEGTWKTGDLPLSVATTALAMTVHLRYGPRDED